MTGCKSNIKSEIFVDAFGQEEGLKVRAETDPEVIKALDLLPQARALAENAKKVIAERNSGSLKIDNYFQFEVNGLPNRQAVFISNQKLLTG